VSVSKEFESHSDEASSTLVVETFFSGFSIFHN
jgi:hypothetical protein